MLLHGDQRATKGLDELLIELLLVARGPYCLIKPGHLPTSFEAIEAVTQLMCEACVHADYRKVTQAHRKETFSRDDCRSYHEGGHNRGFTNNALLSFANIIV